MAVTINNFWGAETGGLEEVASTGGSPVVSTAQAKGGIYSYQLPTVNDRVDFNCFSHIASAGNKHIFGINSYHVTLGGSVIVTDVSTTRLIQVDYKSDGALELLNTAGTVLATSSIGIVATGVWNYLEVYFDNVDSGVAEVFMNGTRVISVSASDFASGSALTYLAAKGATLTNLYVDNMYWVSGAVSAADRLGPVGVLAYRSTRTGNSPDTGSQIPIGQSWADAQNIPFSDASLISYDGTPLAGNVLTDDAPWISTVWSTVPRWDGTPSDPHNAWTNEANFVDASSVTETSTTTTGDAQTNYLESKGISTIPASIVDPGPSIEKVDVSLNVTFISGTARGAFEVFSANRAQSLSTSTDLRAGITTYTLSVPGGEWTWARLRGLEIVLWKSSGGAGDEVRFSEAYVTVSYGRGPNLDPQLNRPGAVIKAAKGIWRGYRDGGGGTVHSGTLGNSTDGTSAFTLSLTTSVANYFALSESSTVVPTNSEFFRIGFGVEGAQDFNLYEMLAQLLYVLPPPNAFVWNPRQLMNNFLVR